MTNPGRSGDWDGRGYAQESHHHRAVDDWFLDRLRPAPRDAVIDLGCGSGEFTARLAELAERGHVVGVDPDPSMLATARRHARPNLEFVAAAAEEVDHVVAPASADVVLSRAMLHWLAPTEYPKLFAAILRILRPGGWFHCESAASGNVPQVTALLDDVAARFDIPTPRPFPEAGAVFELVEQAGFALEREGVRTVVQRRPFTREQMIGLLRTQATVVLTRERPELAPAIVDEVLAGVDRTRRWDGTYDQTFVRLEILAQRPLE